MYVQFLLLYFNQEQFVLLQSVQFMEPREKLTHSQGFLVA